MGCKTLAEIAKHNLHSYQRAVPRLLVLLEGRMTRKPLLLGAVCGNKKLFFQDSKT
jgi:hypothetical protein